MRVFMYVCTQEYVRVPAYLHALCNRWGAQQNLVLSVSSRPRQSLGSLRFYSAILKNGDDIAVQLSQQVNSLHTGNLLYAFPAYRLMLSDTRHGYWLAAVSLSELASLSIFAFFNFFAVYLIWHDNDLVYATKNGFENNWALSKNVSWLGSRILQTACARMWLLCLRVWECVPLNVRADVDNIEQNRNSSCRYTNDVYSYFIHLPTQKITCTFEIVIWLD